MKSITVARGGALGHKQNNGYDVAKSCENQHDLCISQYYVPQNK
ncbi:BQ5605_C007g04396 [Microbotryum silenes-dioicae]|uniref:BQ5605_C007g04396 protein n=1 Tax=Microbotryum silenes-dioicae TaxID=796604 RepID=A0A2X0M9V1_9BASI|nr:BQ5605_C007g04396 [Microbotryum silenes-dioicae]